MKHSNSDIISLHVYNNSPYQITLPLGLLGYCETNATTSPTNEVAYRVNNILQLLDICQSTILNEELSINNIISSKKETLTTSQKHHILNLRIRTTSHRNNKLSSRTILKSPINNINRMQVYSNIFRKESTLLASLKRKKTD